MIVALRGNEISETQDCITSLGISPTSILLKEGTDISTYINPIGDTWHYAMSRVVFDIERISTHKTVRYWDEDYVEKILNGEISSLESSGFIPGSNLLE